MRTDARFNEVTRDEPFHGDFRARRRAYVAGADHSGWERREQVVARFGTALQHWYVRAATRPLVIATHGMAMTLWPADAVGLADPAGFRDDLRLPDLFEINPITRTSTRVVAHRVPRTSAD
ncbi:hypothetical protein GCM10010172_38930 [Paractinoplanes ferrugineus]|uniref:Phosphoglycerate mutase n=1 Tax=Paractinoplanes ferrugineus TaxID=113564 RepID=A0A919J508_9ACTN|nr:hypothetical protein [Actinoplanes ferrugineus]GIE12669.1 hypothetical protein Afe05nite_45090 [Actinoplanes ferrugineus]